MRAVWASLCYFCIFLLAGRNTHSTSGFVLQGLAPLLLLDRYVFRILPWSEPVRILPELSARIIFVLAGCLIAYFIRFGLVPVREAATMGVLLCMGAFLVEAGYELASHLIRASLGRTRAAGSTASTKYLHVGCILVASTVLAAPLEVLHPLRTVPKRSPASEGLDYETVTFTTQDGVLLAGWMVPHGQARGSVIFCHGHGRNREQGSGLLRTFHELGLNVLAFDFRGHGDSEGHTATFGYREVADVVAAENFVAQRLPGKPVFLVGISYGAAVALQALPELASVRGVWCEGSFSSFVAVMENKIAGIPSSVRCGIVCLYELAAWLDCGVWLPNIRPIDRLKNSQVPICFCHGTEDELIPFSQGETLHALYQGPKDHYWVPGATHYDIRRHHKDEYLLRLRAFLNLGLDQTEPILSRSQARPKPSTKSRERP